MTGNFGRANDGSVMIVVAALVLGAAPAPALAPAKLAGRYEIHQMEMGGGLELKRDGHFRYALSYGAVDEEGQGTWTFDGRAIHLTSNPMPKEPSFELVRDTPAPKCTLSVSVDWGRFSWSSPPDVLVTYEDSPRELHFLQPDEGGTLHPANCAVASMLPIVPMFDVPGEPLKLASTSGHQLLLRFLPNDLGRTAFRGEPLKIDGSALVMQRYDAEIRFIRVRP
jgi:hypothetical protein